MENIKDILKYEKIKLIKNNTPKPIPNKSLTFYQTNSEGLILDIVKENNFYYCLLIIVTNKFEYTL